MDFTLDIYREFLEKFLDNGYAFITFDNYCNGEIVDKMVILRHDVDLKPENSVETAIIEAQLGIRASYYFRKRKHGWDKDAVKQIAELGHEVGYHYETLTTCKGDINKAYDLFKNNLTELRCLAGVKTICMHGSPKSNWDSKNIWNSFNYRELGLIGEPYFDIDFSSFFYLTDTGRMWDGYNVSIRDKIPLYQDEWIKKGLIFHATKDIIQSLKNGLLPPQIMITTHPQRWTNNRLLNMNEYIMQGIKNNIKRLVLVKNQYYKNK